MKHVPNIITFSRIAVLLALVWLTTQHWTGAATLTFFCVLYGAISDFLDGYIARKYNLVTNFGKIMDAIVDKVMVLGSFALLLFVPWEHGSTLLPFWTWPFCVLIAVRELGITWMRVIAARKGVILEAEKAGKRKTIWQVTAICTCFGAPMFEHDFEVWLGVDLGLMPTWVWLNGLLYFALASYLTISSGALYVGKYWRVFTQPAVRA